MAQGRSEAQWAHTSAVLAMLVNVNRDPTKGRVAKPDDFNPHVNRGSERLPGNIRMLKKVFVKEKA